MDSLLSYGLCYKNALKKIVHFQMSQIAKNCIIFKKFTIYGILRFLLIWIRSKRVQNRRFWAILSKFRQKMDLNFFKFSKIAAETSKIADFEFFHEEFKLARIWEFQIWSIFWNWSNFWQFDSHLKNEPFL